MRKLFYYGLYQADQFKSKTGEISPLSDYELGAIDRGMEFIALHRPRHEETLDGWCYLICGESAESLMDECRRFWGCMSRERFGDVAYRRDWLLRRLDRADFSMIDYDKWGRPYYSMNSRLFS